MDTAAIIAANAPGVPFRTGLRPGDLPLPTFWTRGEDLILLATYPAGGTRACVKALPGRAKHSIRQRIYLLRKRGEVA